jgi:hypothetical protein
VVVLLLPLSLAKDDGEFNRGGGGGGGGGPVAVAAVAAIDYRDRWCLHLVAEAALDGGQVTTSRCSKRAAIRGIVFGCAAMARAMVVALEEEGNVEGKKSNGNCNKVGDGKQR